MGQGGIETYWSESPMVGARAKANSAKFGVRFTPDSPYSQSERKGCRASGRFNPFLGSRAPSVQRAVILAGGLDSKFLWGASLYGRRNGLITGTEQGARGRHPSQSDSYHRC
jgi:hypothetical protein